MSLKVWLPLNGDLRNNGTLDVVITNNGATIDNNGKIGQCYQFDNNSSYIDLNHSELYNILNGSTQPFSICFWVYHADTSRAIIFGDYAVTGYKDFNIELATNHTLRWYWGSPDIGISEMNVGLNTWTHVTFTYSGTVLKGYINGIEKYTYTITLNAKNRTTGSYYLGRDGRTGTTTLNGKLNDFRIYDHCLSAAEVHEIAQGLILHYKLDGNGFGNPNLLAKYVVPGQAAPTSTADGGRTTWLGDYKITIPAAQNADTYFRLFMTEQLVSGTTYTISCKVSGLLDGSYYRFPLFAQSNTDMGLLYIDHNGLCSLTFTMNWTGTQTAATGANGETVYVNLLDDAARSLVSGQGPITLYDFKLEKGDTATPWCPADSELTIDRTIISDSSGYNHNATAISALATTSDTPRYSTATTFDGTNYGYIQSTVVESDHLSSEYTWSGWIYRDYTDESTRYLYNGIIRIYLNTNFSTRMQWNHGKSDGTASTNTSDMGIIIPYREWTHLVWTFKDGYLKIYINGEYRNYSDRTGTGQFIKGYINQMIGTNTSSVCQWIGNISDMRIYTTALLDNDIKLLYNMGMRVDNLGEVHGFELDENQPNLMWRPENARAAGLGMNYNEGLGSYTQSNCQVTCDSNGYHIYRPPNLTVADNGNTMWGGLRIRNSTVSAVHVYDASIDNIFGLIKGHTYIFIITVEGKSSNNFSSIGITNLMGWGGGGLMPSPSNITYKLIGANFNGKTECYYKFTISDDIVKTCTTAYSSFINGNQYLSYMDFMFGFAYESTGSLGTDLYISNIRLFDLTNKTSKNIQKSGIIEFTQFIEKEENITKIRNDEELYATEFIEI